MLGLLLIYFIGKRFYELAEEHNHTKWGFAILGVISYYLGTFVGGIVIAIVLELWTNTSFDSLDDWTLGFMALPFGLLSCIGLYYLLRRMWSKHSSFDPDIIDQIGKE